MNKSSSSPVSLRLKNLLADRAADLTLKQISEAFDEAEVPYVANPNPNPNFNGAQRRTMVAGYYNGLSWDDPEDVRKFLNALTNFLLEGDRVHEVMTGHRWFPGQADEPPVEHPMAKIIAELSRCGYEWRDGSIISISASARLSDAKAFATAFQLNHLADHIKRIETAVDTDPALAIGSAKELVETVAKTILTKRGVPFGVGDDVLQLGKAVFKVLKQLPDDIPDQAKGAEVIKRMLSNLASVVQGVAELRGLYGTGHGKAGNAKGLQPRHARLAVGMATTLAVYWADTDKDTP